MLFDGRLNPDNRWIKRAQIVPLALVSVSLVQGYAFLEQRQWDTFNEGITLIESVETYKIRFGAYPKRSANRSNLPTRENLTYCKERGIWLNGSALPLQFL
ncbi:hypothetical protein AN963_08525 [Brevibacillus choshinensis]|uniref:Transposase n=1 Tax=Brevibacillus choshinensis TaxID=54911 RepID=A0ABR5NDV4_BRECH|nr:hypothetical protein AN963_08525 [Brevibacillus choshinensis]